MKGSISTKIIRGKKYHYLQYREGNRVLNRSLSAKEAYDFSFRLVHEDADDIQSHHFHVTVRFGYDLHEMADKVASFRFRYAYSALIDYLHNDVYGRVCILYGIRRVGKTTLMFQSLLSLPINEFSKAAFIRVREGDTFDGLEADLDYLTKHGFTYLFIDEVTLLSSFVSSGSVLSDIYGYKAKIVLSGTDSLGFLFAKHDELYDRATMIHLSYISFKEWSEVLGKDSIIDYMEMGGTMSIEGVDYNADNSTHKNEYVDTAIAKNIEHSLALYEDGSHFCSLYPLYEKKELTNAINRLIEDRNHRFAMETLKRDFRSHDFGSLKDLVRKERNGNELKDALAKVNEEVFVSYLKDKLSILDEKEREVPFSDDVISEIDEYLTLLDVLGEINIVRFGSVEIKKKKVFTIPGLRYAQAKAFIESLFSQEHTAALSFALRKDIQAKALSDIQGRMLEEIVLYETSYHLGEENVFQLLFAVGEYDMVVLDEKEGCADIYEIKHSSTRDPLQYRHLIDPESNAKFESNYYPIRSRIVLYMGEDANEGVVEYKNVASFLKAL